MFNSGGVSYIGVSALSLLESTAALVQALRCSHQHCSWGHEGRKLATAPPTRLGELKSSNTGQDTGRD